MTKAIALKTAVATQIRVNGWKNTAIQRINARSDKGQTSVEYLGIIAVVVGIVVILITTNFGSVIATATAAIEPRCRWQPAQPSATPSLSASSATAPGGPSQPQPSPGTLTCDGRSWVIDPTNLSLFPSAADLFSVHLTS